MKTIEVRVIKIEEGMDFRGFPLKEEDSLERKGKIEVVREVYRENGRLLRFRTVRKNEDNGIVELSYCVDINTGEIGQRGSGIYYWMNVPSPFRRSSKYPELNKFLKKRR